MAIKALSVLDGRYAKHTDELCKIFSEYGLIRHRVEVEIEWFKFILSDLKLSGPPPASLDKLDNILDNFDESDALEVKNIEKTTNHDVKAVEYFIKNRLANTELASKSEWVHFACTSDDINNISYALMLKKGKQIVEKALEGFISAIEKKALDYKACAMMSRTHGQPATPTTMGKEFVNYAWRLNQELDLISNTRVQAKINGATGNYNAHCFVFPEVDWISAGQRFLSSRLKLDPILFTTQINPNTSLAWILHSLIRSAAVVVDFDRDMWGYISIGYFKQNLKPGETGSSTMPHKVNPIDFENSEGNMGLAISMMEHMAVKLQKSRFQRDLSDSTVLRNMGSLLGYYLIGIKSAVRGIEKLTLDQTALFKDLDENLVLLAEPFQTVMRVFGEKNPYERLKEITRGKKTGQKELEEFVDKLENVPFPFKERMKGLTTRNYTGLAEQLVDFYFSRREDGSGE